MAYPRTEYHREVNRDDDRDNKSGGGWKSWFGLADNKDRDEDRDRGYNYQATTTYRADHPSSYGYSGQRYPDTQRTGYTGGYSGAVSTGYTGARGGYGYTTSDEVNRGPSWNTDRDYQTRTSYGQPTGDRDIYYKQETRTYGGDRDYATRSYTPSRSYGFAGEHTGRDYTTTSRDYPTSRDYTTTSRDYPTSRDYTTRDYPTRDYTSRQTTLYDRDYPTSRGYGFSGDRDYNVSRTYTTGGDRDFGYSSTGRSTGYGGERTYGGDSRGYSTGYTGGEYTRPSYQPSSYRY